MKHLALKQRAVNEYLKLNRSKHRHLALADFGPVTSGLREAVQHAHQTARRASSYLVTVKGARDTGAINQLSVCTPGDAAVNPCGKPVTVTEYAEPGTSALVPGK